jgi:catalase
MNKITMGAVCSRRTISRPQNSTPAELVDALNGVFGRQIYNRAVYAEGIMVKERFPPIPAAASWSKAPHCLNTVAASVRFSNFARIPMVSQTDALTNPRNMAQKTRDC